MKNLSKLKDVELYTPDVFTDYRGDYWTTWKKGRSYDLEFNHDKVSVSRKNVLRGIHGDFKSYKLITCLHGEIYSVIVDNRKDSTTYLQWDWTILDDKNKNMILIPPGFGNSYLILSDKAVVHYKWSYEGDYADIDDQFTLKWNSLDLNIDWPISNPILSKRDR